MFNIQETLFIFVRSTSTGCTFKYKVYFKTMRFIDNKTSEIWYQIYIYI